MSIKLITDSLSDLSPELIKKLDVTVIPLTVSFNGDNNIYHDGVDINASKIFKKVEELDCMPNTAAIPPFEFEQHFRKEIEQGNQVLYIAGGSTISSTYKNACLAAEEVDPANIAIVDSLTLSTGIALLLVKAKKLIDEGKQLNEIKESIEKLVPKTNVKFSIDVMTYIYKGGRCSAVSYYVGKILHIHPIIKVYDGVLKIFDKPRGNYSKAINVQLDSFKQDLPNVDIETIFVTHCKTKPEDLNKVIEEVKKLSPQSEVYVTEAGATISSHCGPNSIGILYLMK